MKDHCMSYGDEQYIWLSINRIILNRKYNKERYTKIILQYNISWKLGINGKKSRIADCLYGIFRGNFFLNLFHQESNPLQFLSFSISYVSKNIPLSVFHIRFLEPQFFSYSCQTFFSLLKKFWWSQSTLSRNFYSGFPFLESNYFFGLRKSNSLAF